MIDRRSTGSQSGSSKSLTRYVATLRHVPGRGTPYRRPVSDIPRDAGSTWATALKRARKAKGLTQDQLADEAGVHRTTVIRQERGEVLPDRATVRKLAAILDINAERALALIEGDADAVPLPPPLPREIARLVEIYFDLTEEQRRTFLERVGWVAEWAEGWLLSQEQMPNRRRRATG